MKKYITKQDMLASVVVFLVALPLCMGIALASGVSPARGLVTGIIGGIITGFLAGAPLQVSGPAAGLTVLVYDLVQNHGVEWLGVEADRLGNTRFEMRPHEVEARKRQRLPPGSVTIGLHPIFADDEILFRHTLVHELLHAAGMTEHDSQHSELVNEIAPSPKLSESPILQEIRNQALGQQEVKDWTCSHCGFVWTRTTVRTPSRCPKCARPFR